MEKKNSFHHSNLGNNYLSIYRDYLSLLCMHDCLALSEISIDCNKYTPIIVQLCLKDEDLKCIKRVSETIQCLEKWQHNEAVKLCSYVSFVPLCCVFASGQGLSCYLRPVGKAITCLSHPCSEVGCWVWNILKSISLHWKKQTTIIPRHGGNRPEPNVCSNVGTHKWHSSQLHIKRFPSTWFWLGQNPEKKKKRVTAEMSSIIGVGKCKQPTLCCRALICLCNCEMVSFEETRYKMLSILNSIWKQLLHVSCCNHILEVREPLLGLFFFFFS